MATNTFCPAATFGAPHTMFNNSEAPTLTLVILNLSASGCFSFSTTSPITIPFKPPFTLSKDSMPSTSNPEEVRYSSTCSGVKSISIKVFNQL